MYLYIKQGWSDNFASQSSYNEHYWAKHGGMIDNKTKRRQEIRAQRKQDQEKWRKEKQEAINLGVPLPKKPRRKVRLREYF